MRIAFCTAHPYLPQFKGGAQRSMQQLAVALSGRGHEIAFLTGMIGSDLLGFKGRMKIKLSKSNLFKSYYDGFDVYRTWEIENGVNEFCQKFQPDLALCFSGRPSSTSKAFYENDVLSVIYFRNVEFDDIGDNPACSAHGFISNSSFTSAFVKDKFDINAIAIPPLVERELYETRPGAMVTFVNPHPDKGRDIVFELVRRLDRIPFLIVYSWSLDQGDRKLLQSLAEECDNLTIAEATDDMRDIYSKTKILLAPSQWLEAWGRIATEAHFSAIPVIASDAGGLPEAVGPGGVIIPRSAPIEHWESALLRMWDDPQYYESVSRAAFQYSLRHEIQPEAIIDKLEHELRILLEARS